MASTPKPPEVPETSGAGLGPAADPAKTTTAMPLKEQASELANPSKWARTKAKLDAQPKVVVMLERRPGEFPRLDIAVNGVRYSIERGVATEVPQQIAQMVYERLASENKLAQVSSEMLAKLQAGNMA